MKINIAIAGSMLIAAFALTACGGETEEETAAKDKAADTKADTNQSPVSSCDWNDMEKQRLNILSWADEADICATMQSTLNRPPSIALVRELSKAVFVMQAAGSKDTSKEMAYQMMNIVEARGQENDNAAIDSTFDTITKIFNGTQGHVTPKDVNVFLRSSGPMAKTLNDDGIISMGAVMWEDKKSSGE